MTRLLILIFAFNTLIMPMSVQGGEVCEMMLDGSSMSFEAPDQAMLDMNCDMPDSTTCSSLDCMSSCGAVSVIPLIPCEKSLFVRAIDIAQQQPDSTFFYNIVHPINTPPPLFK